MNGPDGLLGELCVEHRALEALLRRLDLVHARGEHAVADGGRLLTELAALLDEHTAVEEAYFYPLVVRHLPAGGALADAARHAHAAVRRLLARAADERLPASDRTRCTGSLLVLLRTHLRGENERLFPLVRAAVPAAELRRQGERLAEARPCGSGAPVWGLPPGTGAIAAVRDRLTGHNGADHQNTP
ncbi:hemerythrin domain-containing protein [Kitasatospora sp. NPDC089913]|uniref:hemerythrin domain-containing protein n=1 Tax=Streptomycetaceae TaxID=2062 RepID=UPI0008794AD8|nr:hemerythrin domain-containing protein [Streptomyces sp. TLI_053]SDT82843.1 Hemerythrin HHE cation binding domain-containing protein [Streptomyces sp. TLI_053]